MHASITPVSISGLSGSGTATALHILSVHETKGKDYGHATVSYDFRDGDKILAAGTFQMSADDYALGAAEDAEVAAWLAAKLNFVTTGIENSPTPERKVDEQQDPQTPEG